MSVIKEEWKKVTKEFPPDVSDNWWLLIDQKYNEPNRQAHDINSLGKKIEELSKFKSKLNHVNAFVLALFFQYLNYDVRVSDFQDTNIRAFSKFAMETGMSDDDVELVKMLLESCSSQLTEEHKTDTFGGEDIHYFLDLDMLPLGSNHETYAEYSEKVAKEYSFLDNVSYKKLRQRVLQSFLLIPHIYASKLFRDNYEESAKSNIKNELKELPP